MTNDIRVATLSGERLVMPKRVPRQFPNICRPWVSPHVPDANYTAGVSGHFSDCLQTFMNSLL